MFSILFKMALPIITTFIVSIIGFSYVVHDNFNNFIKLEKKNYKKELTNSYKESLKDLVTVAYKVAEYNHKLYPNNQEKAKEITIKTISKMRYGKAGYFFAYEKQEMGYKFAFHSTKPKLNGKVANLEGTDPKGYKFRKDLVRTDKGDNNFVEYFYEKPGTKKIIKKMAYSKYFAPWNWSIVTGVYIDDINAKIKHKIKVIEKQSSKFYFIITIISSSLIILFIILFIFVGKKVILDPIKIISQALKRIGSSEISNDSILESSLIENRNDEFKDVMENLNDVINKYSEMFSLLKEKFIELANESKLVKTISDKLQSESTTLNKESNTLILTSKNSNNNVSEINNKIQNSLYKTDEISNISNTVVDKMNKNENLIVSLLDYSNSMASSIEEMIATITEISQNSISAINVSTNVEGKTLSLIEKIETLKENSDNIGQFTEVIKAIASQTNLLALNATIEAARAGEAGKGFAVVANEIKNLANETADATLKIEKQINDIQNISLIVSDIANEANGAVSEMKDVVDSISASLQEQEATTNEVSKNILDTNNKLNQISNHTQEVISSTQNLTSSIHNVRNDVQEIALMSNTTKELSDSVSNSGGSLNAIVKDLNDVSSNIHKSSDKLLKISKCKFI